MPREVGFLTVLNDHEIINKFNSFMTGIGNYYVRTINYISRLNRWHYILYYSCIKTLATKHRITVKAVINKYGFRDISNPLLKNYRPNATDLRIVAKYERDKETKYTVLLNYKEFMFRILVLKHSTNPPKQIDFHTLHKVNFRTAFKLTSKCIICGKTKSLQNHHIKPVKHSGGRYTGYKGFDKVVGSLGRKQIPVCSACHQNIHNGKYRGMSLGELFDVRLGVPESLIKLPQTTKSTHTFSNDATTFIIDENSRTYLNMSYKNFLLKKQQHDTN